MDTDHYVQAFRMNSLTPWTTRSPRFTCDSDGYPRRRFDVTSKPARFVEPIKFFVFGIHDDLLWDCWEQRFSLENGDHGAILNFGIDRRSREAVARGCTLPNASAQVNA